MEKEHDASGIACRCRNARAVLAGHRRGLQPGAVFAAFAARAPGSLICPCADAEERASIESRFGVDLVPFDRYRMGRRARLRIVKYLGYPFFVKRLLAGVQAHDPMDVVLAQHSISGVGAGWFRRRSGVRWF